MLRRAIVGTAKFVGGPLDGQEHDGELTATRQCNVGAGTPEGGDPGAIYFRRGTYRLKAEGTIGRPDRRTPWITPVTIRYWYEWEG